MSTPLFTAEDMVVLGKAMAGIGEAFTSMASVLAKAGERKQPPAGGSATERLAAIRQEAQVIAKQSPTAAGLTIQTPVAVKGDSKCVAATTPAPVEPVKPVFRPAPQTYRDLPRCGECKRPMRPMGSKAADWPGTINRISTTVCGTCYNRERARQNGAVPRKPKEQPATPPAPAPAPAPIPTPTELKKAREAKELQKKREALKAEARHQAKVDTAAEREARIQRELASFLEARHKRGVPPEGVVMPGEQPDKPNASQS